MRPRWVNGRPECVPAISGRFSRTEFTPQSPDIDVAIIAVPQRVGNKLKTRRYGKTFHRNDAAIGLRSSSEEGLASPSRAAVSFAASSLACSSPASNSPTFFFNSSNSALRSESFDAAGAGEGRTQAMTAAIHAKISRWFTGSPRVSPPE